MASLGLNILLFPCLCLVTWSVGAHYNRLNETFLARSSSLYPVWRQEGNKNICTAVKISLFELACFREELFCVLYCVYNCHVLTCIRKETIKYVILSYKFLTEMTNNSQQIKPEKLTHSLLTHQNQIPRFVIQPAVV